MIENIENKSQEEVIEILHNNGIQVIMKPVALMPDNMSVEGFGRQSIGVEQMDIYDALRRLENRSRIAKDPFS